MKEKIVRNSKLTILEIIQGDKVLFTGNTNEIKEHFGVNKNKVSQWRGNGIHVENGTVPRPTTIYAKVIGHEYGEVVQYRGTSKDAFKEIEEEKLRETETKEERQLRRQTKRKIMMENLRKEYFNG
ncbi:MULTISPECIES: hypothetical protein [Lactococcus]|uniref:Uncharacterized protein n=1 Tax=Lactococcus garvieae DCC43 TaxID=1231377 RepID=K2PL18_9LACT|nr:hypothetical protein [Lactococcus garvieae]EKF50934.1 hypothetical protein C426_1706 [Lactococcus garvieae DCC43]